MQKRTNEKTVFYEYGLGGVYADLELNWKLSEQGNWAEELFMNGFGNEEDGYMMQLGHIDAGFEIIVFEKEDKDKNPEIPHKYLALQTFNHHRTDFVLIRSMTDLMNYLSLTSPIVQAQCASLDIEMMLDDAWQDYDPMEESEMRQM
ncbi:hypothetical protein [Ammoniphilus sp. 3BR4]|uniref:hypothetical protein n=1 Tax=Ammoniphilus sp. 3BR4 TaxID=3158265 RepID=UPI0034658D78